MTLRIKDIYHFHKDCKYYPNCTEKLVKKGKSEYIEFTCPMLRYPVTYYKRDIHTIKWSCPEFEAYQPTLWERSDKE